jgi:hypothetical protein
MIDWLKKLAIQAVIVAVLGGIIAYIMGMILPIVSGINIVGGMIAGIVAIVLYAYIAGFSDVDTAEFGYLVPLLAFVSIIGTFVVGIMPGATGYILTLSSSLTWVNTLWTLIYAGAALAITDKIM